MGCVGSMRAWVIYVGIERENDINLQIRKQKVANANCSTIHAKMLFSVHPFYRLFVTLLDNLPLCVCVFWRNVFNIGATCKSDMLDLGVMQEWNKSRHFR